MRVANVGNSDVARIYDGVCAMQESASLEETALSLVDTAMDLVACDHGGYSEVDLYFGRTRLYSSAPEVGDWVRKEAETWAQFMPDHPVLKYRKDNPDVAVVRLSNVVVMSDFYHSGLYNVLFREVDTRHQLVMHLGHEPRNPRETGALPLTLGVPLNRSGRDFSDRDVDVLRLLQRLARPVLLRKRAEHLFRQFEAAEMSEEVERCLLGLGLTGRQCEIAFWMLKGKSNGDIGEILALSPQTVRHHSIGLYRKLRVFGRLDAQRAIFRAISGIGSAP